MHVNTMAFACNPNAVVFFVFLHQDMGVENLVFALEPMDFCTQKRLFLRPNFCTNKGHVGAFKKWKNGRKNEKKRLKSCGRAKDCGLCLDCAYFRLGNRIRLGRCLGVFDISNGEKNSKCLILFHFFFLSSPMCFPSCIEFPFFPLHLSSCIS